MQHLFTLGVYEGEGAYNVNCRKVERTAMSLDDDIW